ncbi:TPA: hypothetical protein N0F65_001475 [Lagenidium giganteum]|uniref:NrS-1 polymerase-like helicase domain-containing protein n=1 Tax=Lagenidium giganteum TaxID=4803 RepID=A0AAV2YL34_9STRA|nr:TPA: hypothetical protein N0F65_001475 [Lagenidium giganteum]
MEIGGPRIENLKSINGTFYESFDHNKLAFIINNLDEIKKKYRDSARDALSLDKYYEASKQSNRGLGSIPVDYIQNGNDTIRGRYQARGSLSGQNMVREVRHTIFDDFYIDIDMDNCHPVITVWMCDKLGIPCDYMRDYVNYREERIQEIIEANPLLSRDDVKRLFLSIIYGVAYKNESASIKTKVCKAFKYFKIESDKHRIKSGKNFNLEGAAMSHVCCFVENQLLMIIMNYLKSKLEDISDSILCFDGVMISMSKYNKSYLKDLEEQFSFIGIPIKLSVKQMKPLDLSKIGSGYKPNKVFEFILPSNDSHLSYSRFNQYSIDDKELTARIEHSVNESLPICEALSHLLKLLPKEMIRINDMITSYDLVSGAVFSLREAAKMIKRTFAYIYNDGDCYYIVKSTQTIRFKDGDVKVFMLDFCHKSIMYKNVDVIPHSPLVEPKLNGEFNLFGQYQHQYDPNFVIDETLVSKWTNHIKDVVAAGDEVVGEYLINWFAHLLQHPERKTESVPLIKGIPGSGKNLCFNVFQRYVLNPSLSICCPDMDKLFTRFNSARMGKLLIVLDEAVDSGDRKMNNKMKNFITEERVQIENKGKDVVEVSDFSNYAVITNNDFASVIEQHDRRYICITAAKHRVGDRKYFQDMITSLLNVNAGKHLFHYLLRRDLTQFETRDLPSPSYKKELATKQANNVVKWLLSKYESLIDDDDQEQYSLPSGEWYRQYQKWCEACGESKVYSLSIFNQMMNSEGLDTKVQRVKDPSGKWVSIKERVVSSSIIKDKLAQYIV